MNNKFVVNVSAEIADFASFVATAKFHQFKSCFMSSFHADESPFLSRDLFSGLPPLLQELIELYRGERERDISLLSSIVAFGSIFPMVRGIYDERTVHPNLYLCVCAPAASGKGILVDSGTIIRRAAGKIAPNFMVPGNTSSSALINQIAKNLCGLLLESESDTVKNAFKQEWGAYSDLLRKAFHHEPVSKGRVKGGDLNTTFDVISVEYPKLSILISGTPETVKQFISSLEDGLFSRVIFYRFNELSEWRSPRSTSKVGREKSLKSLGEKVEKLYDSYAGKDVLFELTDEQWETLDCFYHGLLSVLQESDGSATESLVKRSGLICFRIAMVLTILTEPQPQDVITCSTANFNCALALATTAFKHSYLQHLAGSSSDNLATKSPAEQLYNHLSEGVGYMNKDIESVVKENMNLSPRTANSLKKILERNGRLRKPLNEKLWYKVPRENG